MTSEAMVTIDDLRVKRSMALLRLYVAEHDARRTMRGELCDCKLCRDVVRMEREQR